MRSWNSHRWSLPIAACRPPGWHMNLPGRLYLVLVMHTKKKKRKRRKSRWKCVKIHQIQSNYLNVLSSCPKTFKDTTTKNVNSVSCNKNLVYTKDDRNTHLATHYQQLHTEGRGLNTLFSFRQTLQKNLICTIQLERDLTWAWSIYMDNTKVENHMPMILMN